MYDSFVAKEGKSQIKILFFLLVFFYIMDCDFLSLLSFVALLFTIYIYRFKFIDIATLKNDEIYSPIDGKVISIDTNGFKKSITIDVSIFDSHILRSLGSSKVEISHKKGTNLLLDSYKAKKFNETFEIKYENMKMKLISSLFNPSLNIQKKENYKKGEKITTFIHGQVIINFESNIEINVSMNDKVISGKTVIAKKIKNS
ncbi:phosphatidylserine decarboxylase [Halarcobacter sp.]|uniref:phosphatidylserine decarboxylase n=1 Tax=Halarcobacter sp. TaxID=2321133 RepID=UPI002AA91F3C|nr:phosphatidylserine decarboxylase [Halarcobacter sp.]